jgi:hypothetical protein
MSLIARKIEWPQTIYARADEDGGASISVRRVGQDWKPIKVVPVEQLRGAVSLLDDLADVLADVRAGVVPADGSVVRDVLKRAARHANGGQ